MAVDFDGFVDPARLEVVLSDRQPRTCRILAHVSEIRDRVRNTGAEVSARHEDSRHLAQSEIEVVDDLEHVVSDDNIEHGINKRQGRTVRDRVVLAARSCRSRRSQEALGRLNCDDAVTTDRQIASDAPLTATHFECALPSWRKHLFEERSAVRPVRVEAG